MFSYKQDVMLSEAKHPLFGGGGLRNLRRARTNELTRYFRPFDLVTLAMV